MNQSAIVDLMLSRIAEERDRAATQWENPVETPTRHFVIDDLLPIDIAREAYAAFPSPTLFALQQSFRERKRILQDPSLYTGLLGAINGAMQDQRVLDAVTDIAGLEGIENDTTLARGGLSMMLQGDFLNPHIDNSHNKTRDRYRRLNLLYYVSPEWTLENGGNFELWDKSRKRQKTIVSKQNRLLVMETTSTSWHSVSPVVADAPRCCISNYYYSEASPAEREYYHVTSFAGRPDQPIRTAVGALDNLARNMVSKASGLSRPHGAEAGVKG